MAFIKKRNFLFTILALLLLSVSIYASVKIAGNTTNTLIEVDATSKAARVTAYDSAGTEIFPEQHRATYSSFIDAISPPATPTDVFTITGSASKTVKIYRMVLSGVQTTAGVNSWFIVKRSTADSGGTPAAATLVPHDSTDGAATATVNAYTGNPTLGSTVGFIWSGKVNSPAPGTAGIGGFQGVQVDFVKLYGKPVTLRGTGEVLSWSFNGAALPTGLSIHCGVTFTEQ